MLKRSTDWLKANVSSFAKDAKAVTAIEFGLIFPVFAGFIGIVLELALVMFMEFALQAGTQEIGRLVRTGQAQNQQLTNNVIRSRICDSAVILHDCMKKISVIVEADSSFASIVTPVSVAAFANDDKGYKTTPPFECGNPLDVVAVIASYDHTFLMPLSGYFSNLSFTGRVDTAAENAAIAYVDNPNDPQNADKLATKKTVQDAIATRKNAGKVRRIFAYSLFRNEPFPKTSNCVKEPVNTEPF